MLMLLIKKKKSMNEKYGMDGMLVYVGVCWCMLVYVGVCWVP